MYVIPFRELLYAERLKLQQFIVKNENIKKDTIVYLKYEKHKENTKRELNDLIKKFQIYENNVKLYKNKIYNIDFENKILESDTYIVAKNRYVELLDDLKFYETKINSLNFNLDIYQQITASENEILKITKEIEEEELLFFKF